MNPAAANVPASAKVARGVIRTYQIVVSPALHLIAGPGAGCRFLPGCSDYAMEALSIHGIFRGSWLTARRLCKCGPWHRGGWDPVPPKHPRPATPGTKKSGKASTG